MDTRMTNFEELGLPAELVKMLERMQITIPTAIQIAAIPPAINGQDILASAQTGTGKTVAYSIPLIIKLYGNLRNSALILTPTRELAVQVHQTLNEILGKASPFKTTLLIGGAPMFKQIGELRRKPQLIVGTPGRIADHLMRGSLSLNETRFLILDEADRMLDMGFEVQLEKIAEYLPETRQTLMFSATLPSNIERLSKKYLREPQRITIAACEQTTPKIKQEVIHTTASDKFSKLIDQLIQREGSIIVFVKTKHGTERLSKELQRLGHSADAIHGDLPQRRRDRVIREFRSSKIRILVATDVAARGLDIPHVMHVINFDLPQCPEDYIHRIGRTGRAGAEGSALCFILPDDVHKWKLICRLMDPKQAKFASPQGQFEKQHQSKFKNKRRPFKDSQRPYARKQKRNKSFPKF